MDKRAKFHTGRRKLLVAGIGAAVATALPGCYTIHEKPAATVPAAGSRNVMLVGRIEVVPRVATGDQDIDIKNDLFNTKRYMLGRAVMQMSSNPEPGAYQILVAEIINPTLEKTYFTVMPRSERFLAKGYISMEWRDLTPTARGATVEAVELKFPGPIELDIRAEDSAIYLGTLRLHRDVYHTLLKVEVLDHYAAAEAEFRTRFGTQATMRKALLKLPATKGRR